MLRSSDVLTELSSWYIESLIQWRQHISLELNSPVCGIFSAEGVVTSDFETFWRSASVLGTKGRRDKQED